MDKIDRKILALLQKDATMPVAEIGRKVGLSTTPCWRRIQKMEEDGVIKRRVAVLNPAKVNAGVTVFVSVRTNQHNESWLKKFASVVEAHDEVVEFYRMSGDVDYVLRVVVPDIAHYDRFYQKLISEMSMSDVSSAFAMEQIKYTTALPLDFSEIEKEK
ncbi:Lrp/AsnC family transcriptional regulator [Maritalea mobilis]|uniref:Lrp/AsnC family transcriptional regulator n=1 Tax=Maritalea mobilis TaxID=483324 RepID=A0A4R6VNH2_9HYPH|nr:Lrp/AsnC family transcriptional regulator [Maritalea mobilis]TDQ63733.1 Lrp/AsnC family transcriptional regulator [Maritalea mobilis]